MENNLRKLVKNYQKTSKIACGTILLMKESAFGALFRFLKHWTTHMYGIGNQLHGSKLAWNQLRFEMNTSRQITKRRKRQ